MAELHDVVHAIERVARALEALGPARAEAPKMAALTLSGAPYRDGTFIPVAASGAAPVADAWASHVEDLNSFVAGLQALCEEHGVAIETCGPQLRLTTPGATANVTLVYGKPAIHTLTRASHK